MSTPISVQEVQTPTPDATYQPQPRVSSEGMTLPADFQLPALDKVRGDAARIAEFTRNRDDTDSDGGIQLVLACKMLLPNIFKWSFFAEPADTPHDLREACIFTLRMSIRILQECDENDIQRFVCTSPEQDFAAKRLATVMNAGRKLVHYLLVPEIDRPAEALPYLKMFAEEDIQESTQTGIPPWIGNPFLYLHYANALGLSGSTDTQTKLMLERAIEGLMQSDANVTNEIILLKIHLAHVHRCQNIRTAEAKENEHYVIKFLRKNPNIIRHAYLKQALIRPGQPERHVLTALGGPVWFNSAAKPTFKTQERAERMCYTCGGCEPQKMIFRCGGCQHIWYCSKPCQNADWKSHKAACRCVIVFECLLNKNYINVCSEICMGKKEIEALRSSDPGKAQLKSDWMKWRVGPLGANPDVLIHALGLHRDPSRGRTHIVFFSAKYTPDASRDMTHKFQIELAGVYRTSDVIPDIEACLGIKPGQGKEYIDGLLADADLKSVRRGRAPLFPVMCLLASEGLAPLIGCCLCALFGLDAGRC
ncbi:hypothetical protein BJ138DRAFT_587334 [Hygrophoropsis aurantiaca]|uniref:Uncharacterized protein n=1 Tax=Hygrophoropsis aurantiaca TaxID=72124 RepID=A0ACB8A184_9AGAM|nr:hypothetical protein BJ138DRAFT_587334 [Hygrophoropsis aurantiaca]